MVFIKEKISGMWKSLNEGLSKKTKKLKSFFVIKDGDQTKPNTKAIRNMLGFLAIVGIGVYAVKGMNQDTSSVERTDTEIEIPDNSQNTNQAGAEPGYQELLGKEEQKPKKKRPSRKAYSQVQPIKYKAKQVIEREGVFNPSKTIPMGTNLIGRLLTSIDTRESEQFYKVFLPYGGKFQGGAEIPKGSTLFGKIRYPGKGKKVFMSFTKGVFPDGSEFQIQAQALSTKDYSPGLRGDYHGQSGARVAATLGLSLVSGASAMLTEREQIGMMGQTAPKPTLKNALYGGLSQTAQSEAGRQAQQLNERQEYVTVDAGKDLIINLSGAYIQK